MGVLAPRKDDFLRIALAPINVVGQVEGVRGTGLYQKGVFHAALQEKDRRFLIVDVVAETPTVRVGVVGVGPGQDSEGPDAAHHCQRGARRGLRGHRSHQGLTRPLRLSQGEFELFGCPLRLMIHDNLNCGCHFTLSNVQRAALGRRSKQMSHMAQQVRTGVSSVLVETRGPCAYTKLRCSREMSRSYCVSANRSEVGEGDEIAGVLDKCSCCSAAQITPLICHLSLTGNEGFLPGNKGNFRFLASGQHFDIVLAKEPVGTDTASGSLVRVVALQTCWW